MMIRTGMMKTAMALALTIFLFSCASSRYQDGFTYRPAYAGPDMGADVQQENATPSSPVSPNTGSASAISHAEPAAPAVIPDALTKQDTEAMMEMVQTGVSHMEGQGEVKDLKVTMRVMATDYAARHDVQLSGKQMKQLDHLAVKMEKKYAKKQGPNVSWGPSNNLEWAILGAAAVGLFVGIFGIGFGWFIFLVAALAYLYFKLLHNN